MVFLKLFAGASLETEQGPLTGPAAQRRRLALLALLAASHPCALPRDKLLAFLWPERDTQHARNLLSQALCTVRRSLGDDAIFATGDELRFNPAVVGCDVVSFEQALAAGELARAVALYSGPFLDGFFVSDAPEFEQWVDAKRERLARAHGTALERLAEEAAAEEDSSAAVEWWRRRVADDPCNARITRRLMETLAASGDRAGALQQAVIHARLLAQEFGAEPDPEIEALAERLRRGPPATTANPGVAGRPEPRTATADGFEPEADRANGVELGTELLGEPPRAGVASTVSASGRLRARTRRWLRTWKGAAVPTAGVLAFATVLSVVLRLPETSARPGTASEEAAASSRALAVLPCANLSGDPEEEYFSDGLTEELTGVLAQVRSLQVVARTSAFAFKGERRDIREIGESLGVGTVIECSVRRAGERVRVTAQLINAANGFHLWAETYEREGMDVFAIQSDLALRIASALEAELTPAERARIAHRPTDDPQAHALYLKGRHFWNQRTSSGYARAIEYFERAIETDPRYAAAHAGLGIVFILQSISGYLEPSIARDRAGQAARKALELDPELAEAHVALGGYLNVFEWDSEATERELQRAIQLDPSYPYARHVYAIFLTAMGRFEEALIERRKAIELDPLDPHLSTVLGGALLDADRPEEAFEHFRNAIELDSAYWQAHMGLGSYYEATGRFGEAIRTQRRAAELAGARPGVRSGLARVLARAGRKDEAHAILGEIQAEAARTGIYAPEVASVLLALDDVDGALEWLERSNQQRHPGLRLTPLTRFRDPRLADDPRYLDLRRRIGLPR